MQRQRELLLVIIIFFFLGWLLFPEKASIVWLDIPYILFTSFACFIIAVVSHELGHIIANLFVRFKIRQINLLNLSIGFTDGIKIDFKEMNDGILGAVLIKAPDVKNEKEVKKIFLKFLITTVSGPLASLLGALFFFNIGGFALTLLSLMNFLCFVITIQGDLLCLKNMLTQKIYIYIIMIASDLASGAIPNQESGLFIGNKLNNFLKTKNNEAFFKDKTSIWSLNFILILSFFCNTPLIDTELLSLVESSNLYKWSEGVPSEVNSIIKKNLFFLVVYNKVFKNESTANSGFIEEAYNSIEEIERSLLTVWNDESDYFEIDNLNLIMKNDYFYFNVYIRIVQIMNGGLRNGT